MKTIQQMKREEALVKKQIDSGKLSPKKLKAATYRYYNLRYRMGQKTKKARAAFNKDQAFLPSFVKQLDVPRIEELVAEKIFGQIS